MASEIWSVGQESGKPGIVWSAEVVDGEVISMSIALTAEDVAALRAGTRGHIPAEQSLPSLREGAWDLARVNASLHSAKKYHLTLKARVR